MASPQKTQVQPQRTQPGFTPPAPAPGLPHEKIAARAYEIWQQSGRPDGQQLAHWYQAERELRARSR